MLCDRVGRGVMRAGKEAGGGCVCEGGDRGGAIGAVSSTIKFAIINPILAPRDAYNNQHTEVV